ncbi:MAG TPA: M14 family metallocarboxypeptidase [Patescibacteria group bacterium]|nr:M14 family metallocarboxypeptidase [Patescibacteria group bacterium]
MYNVWQNRYRKWLFFVFGMLLTLACLPTQSTLALPYYPDHVYQQDEAVEKQYIVPSIVYSTPAFKPGRESFTSHEEMMEYLYQLQRQSDRLHVKIIGYSQEQRPIPLLIFSKPSRSEPVDIQRLNKPVIWLQGQQHGNEPAGGEAMLVMARKLALEELGQTVLEKVTVLIVPRCNPDGSYYFDRRTARRIDENRDHIKLELPETLALRQAFSAYRPYLAVDNHEYSVAGEFSRVAGHEMLKYHDILLLSATNANVPQKIKDLADGLFLDNVEKALDGQQLTHHWYYTVSGTGADRQLNMGGTDAMIGRNALGLMPALSFLVESRGIGLGRQDFLRRVTGHVVADTALLLTAAQNSDLLRQTVEHSRSRLIAEGKSSEPGSEIVVVSKGQRRENYPFPLVDAVTGEVITLPITVVDVKQAEPVLVRKKPKAYILPPAYLPVAKTLAQSGVTIRVLNRENRLMVESYRVTDKKVFANYFEGHFRNSVQTETSFREVTFPAGSFVITMDQPMAGIIAMSLEPEADSGMVRFNALPVDVNEEVPVFRYHGPGNLDMHPVDLIYTH